MPIISGGDTHFNSVRQLSNPILSAACIVCQPCLSIIHVCQPSRYLSAHYIVVHYIVACNTCDLVLIARSTRRHLYYPNYTLVLETCAVYSSILSVFSIHNVFLNSRCISRYSPAKLQLFPIYTNNLQNHQDITPTISVFMLIGLYIKIIVLRLGGQD